MLVEGRTGIIASASGAISPLRTDVYGALVTKMSGVYSEASVNQRVFSICSQAAVTLSAGLSTTYTGLAVGNPAGSGVNLVMLQAGFAPAGVITAANPVGLMTGLGAITVSLIARNAFYAGVAAKASATAGQTIGTPVLDRVVGYVTTAVGVVLSCVDLQGSLVVTPGSFVAWYGLTGTANMLLSFTWEERPIIDT